MPDESLDRVLARANRSLTTKPGKAGPRTAGSKSKSTRINSARRDCQCGCQERRSFFSSHPHYFSRFSLLLRTLRSRKLKLEFWNIGSGWTKSGPAVRAIGFD